MRKNTRSPVFGLVANTTNEKALRIASTVLKNAGRDIIVEKATATKLQVDGVPLNHMKVDVLITIGGDGTVLRALQQNDAKILAINAGVLGFLTEITENEIPRSIEKIKRGDYKVENTIRLASKCNGKRLFDCTNEAVVHLSQIVKMMRFRVYVDGNLASEVRSDGIILATPTGSTSYALSSGGPIIDPRVCAFVVVPIAPFKLSSRPLVVPAESCISIELAEDDKKCLLVLDGQHSIEITHKDKLEFTISDKPATFIRFKDGFYSRVGEKLKL